jgi:hypothetical protein
MRLSSQVVDLGGPDGADDLDEAVAVDEVAVVKNHFALAMPFRIFVKMLKNYFIKMSYSHIQIVFQGRGLHKHNVVAFVDMVLFSIG